MPAAAKFINDVALKMNANIITKKIKNHQLV